MPTTVFQDAFTEVANTNLESHTPNIGTSWAEAEDTTAGTTIRVVASVDAAGATNNGSSARIIYTCTPSPALTGPDYDVLFTIQNLAAAGGDDPMFVVARWTDVNNYYSAGVHSGASNDFVIAKKVAGVVTVLAQSAFTRAAGDIIKFELRGSTLKLYQNGTERLSVTDSALSGTGAAGIGFGNAWVSTDDVDNNNRLDDFEVIDQNVAAGGQPTIRRFSGAAHISSLNPRGRSGERLHAPMQLLKAA